MKAKITVLPGDGIGVEVTREAVACLETIAKKFGHEFEFSEHLIGGAALDKTGAPLPDATLQACLASDAVLLGAVGAPQYDNNPPKLKPETGLLGLRAGLGVFANLRPAFLHGALIEASPLKTEIVRGTDLLIVRELMGGAADYPDVTLEHGYVDSCAMALVTRPTSFDVIVTENLFGDILSDEAAVLTGSLGMLPSASIGGKVGLYEPVHGSAPDIAGKGVANPLGAIASAAMLLRYTCKLEREAKAIEDAISKALADGYGTPDLKSQPKRASTTELGDVVRRHL